MKHLYNAGDTIIEVLVSIAVVSTVLGGAFVATRNSQVGVRNSQEHAEALKLVESQIEQLRGYSSQAIAASVPFCMYNESPVSTSYSPNIPPAAANCTQNSAGQAGKVDSRYKLTIGRCNLVGCGNNISGSYLFTVTVSWPSVTGNGNEQESMVYRLY